MTDLTFDDNKARIMLDWNPQSVVDYINNNKNEVHTYNRNYRTRWFVLLKLLLEKGYMVHGIKEGASSFSRN
jgi:hypothetical protein